MAISYTDLSCFKCKINFKRSSREVNYQLKLKPEKSFFCSKECRKKEDSCISINCKQCDKTVKIKTRDLKRFKDHFCSHSCSASFNNELRKITGLPLKGLKKKSICNNCNSEIEIALNASHKSAICSICCPIILTESQNRSHQRKKDVQLKCFVCEKKFFSCNLRKQCCSKECLKKKQVEFGKINGLLSAKAQNRRSKNEIMFADLCKKHFSNVLTNEPFFKDSNGNLWDCDVILPDLKIAISWDGIWHFKQVNAKHSVAQVQARDKIKLAVIKASNYTPYNIKDMGKANFKFVEEEFQKFLEYTKTLGWTVINTED